MSRWQSATNLVTTVVGCVFRHTRLTRTTSPSTQTQLRFSIAQKPSPGGTNLEIHQRRGPHAAAAACGVLIVITSLPMRTQAARTQLRYLSVAFG
jgi:hypothetical protein